MRLSHAQVDRACGVLIGAAAGDALGAGYEFGTATVGPEGPRMIGGGLGGFAPGEWTDDTAMAWAIADVAATGVDLRTERALTGIARRFREWYDTRPPDIGNQTRSVLSAAGPEPTGDTMTATSYDLHARTGHTAGNGSLMRTAPVALPYLDDPIALAEAARKVGALTHYDEHAQAACVLWSLAIRHAILHAEFDIRSGWRESAAIAALKMVAQPLVVYGLARALALPPVETAAVVLLAALPVGANVYLMARQFDALSGPVASAIVLTTVLAAFTTPIVLTLV